MKKIIIAITLVLFMCSTADAGFICAMIRNSMIRNQQQQIIMMQQQIRLQQLQQEQMSLQPRYMMVPIQQPQQQYMMVPAQPASSPQGIQQQPQQQIQQQQLDPLRYQLEITPRLTPIRN